MQAALEAQMVAQAQGAGIRILRQVMKRVEKGEAGMRIEIWRMALKDYLIGAAYKEASQLQSSFRAQAVLQLKTETQMSSQSHGMGVKRLQV